MKSAEIGYKIFLLHFANYFVSDEDFCTTIKLLFLLSLVWLTETALI